MSIPKIEPTTKVKEWVNRINLSFDEIRKQEMCWSTTSKVGKSEYEFPIPNGDAESSLKKFGVNEQYTVQYGGVILDPRDYKINGTVLTFVNGPCMENDYAIIVRYVGKAKTTVNGYPKELEEPEEEE